MLGIVAIKPKDGSPAVSANLSRLSFVGEASVIYRPQAKNKMRGWCVTPNERK